MRAISFTFTRTCWFASRPASQQGRALFTYFLWGCERHGKTVEYSPHPCLRTLFVAKSSTGQMARAGTTTITTPKVATKITTTDQQHQDRGNNDNNNDKQTTKSGTLRANLYASLAGDVPLGGALFPHPRLQRRMRLVPAHLRCV